MIFSSPLLLPSFHLIFTRKLWGKVRPDQAHDYGFFDCVVVSREAMVCIETNRYSVPAHLIGQALTARLHRDRIDLFADQHLVASHSRATGQNERIVNPAHFEAAFAKKPRARVMVYRDWLCGLSQVATFYVRDLCQRRRADMAQQIILLYKTAQEHDRADFLAALERAAEQQMYGAEYVQALINQSGTIAPMASAKLVLPTALSAHPAQQEVECDLAHYEQYVANRDSVALKGLQGVNPSTRN